MTKDLNPNAKEFIPKEELPSWFLEDAGTLNEPKTIDMNELANRTIWFKELMQLESMENGELEKCQN